MDGQRGRRLAGWFAVATFLAVVPLPLTAVPAYAANCAEPGRAVPAVPWPQRMLDVERAWPLARGDSVRVAVLDSGVDANHPQLRGRVVPGTDLLQAGDDFKSVDGRADCAGRGTQTAGIVAAQPEQGVGFHGVAPRATIVPVRVSDDESTGPSGGAAGLAAGIRFAVGAGARVILVSFPVYVADAGLQAAVTAAGDADVLVVAAVGDDGGRNAGPDGADGSNSPTRTPYPAAYPGVVGVGAIEESSLLWPQSGRGPFVDLVAPGVAVVSTQRGGGLVARDGTAHAAAFVAGAAALVRARWPQMPAAEVARRLTATATPAPGGADSDRYGHGIVSPYAAVADQLAAGPPASLPGLRTGGAADRERAANWSSSATVASVLAALGLVVVLAVVGIAAALPRGRRARWRARVAPPPQRRAEDEEPAPPVHLFADREG